MFLVHKNHGRDGSPSTSEKATLPEERPLLGSASFSAVSCAICQSALTPTIESVCVELRPTFQ